MPEWVATAVRTSSIYKVGAKATSFWRAALLVVVPHSKTLDLRLLAERIGDGKLSFGSPERLMKHLGLTPGSVSPFGLLNDPGRHVRVFLDRALEGADRLSFHPNDNTATLVLSGDDFGRFLGHVGHTVHWIAV